MVSAACRGYARVPTNVGRGALSEDDGKRRKRESEFPISVGRGATAVASIAREKASTVDGSPSSQRTLREEPHCRTEEPQQPSALPGLSRLWSPVAVSVVPLHGA